ncbi:MAG: NBR1-Ig-like domain-containing protein [Omnitrophica WOR_2 bacterium]
MFTKRFTILIFFFTALFFLSACAVPTSPAQESPDLLYTAAAQTVVAQVTQAAVDSQKDPTATLPAPTATQAPTNTQVPPTPLPPTPVPPTATPLPPTPTPIPCNLAEFIKDVNYPDGSDVEPGQSFDKTWRIKNVGSCTWDSQYKVVFAGGDDLGAERTTAWEWGKVKPGQTVDITLAFTAPEDEDTYKSEWKLKAPDGHKFGVSGSSSELPFWVKIDVVRSVTVTYDFVAKASKAEWRNATKVLPWGDRNSDHNGIAAIDDNFKMENGYSYNDVLGTYPEKIEDGYISGLFSSYKVQRGDFFRAVVGLRSGCEDGQVKIQLKYVENGQTHLLEEWKKTCNGNLKSLEVGLSSLKGKTVQFMLVVMTDGEWRNDQFGWIYPRIEREE